MMDLPAETPMFPSSVRSRPFAVRLAAPLLASLLLAAGPAGAVSFSKAGALGGGEQTQGIAVGDVDGDGGPDAAFGNAINETSSLWANDGTGNFSRTPLGGACTSSTLEFCINTTDAALADVDGDGDLDLLITNEYNYDFSTNIELTGEDELWLNDGNGAFSYQGDLSGVDSEGIAFGDLDSDGDLDAVVVTSGPGTYPGDATGALNEVWKNDGSGGFSQDSIFGPSDDVSYDVALADVDGDGDLDAVVATQGGMDSRIWENDGSGALSAGAALGTAGPRDIATGDVDGDGDTDVLLANLGDPNQVWLNDGAGDFGGSPAQSFGDPALQTKGIALADLDGDGDLDAFAANNQGADSVWENDGSGHFSNADDDGGCIDQQSLMADTSTIGNSNKVHLADFDGDGDVDAVVSHQSTEDSILWENDGAGIRTRGELRASGQSLGDVSTGGVVLGDLDGDGDLDAFMANEGGNAVYTNESDATLNPEGALSLDQSDSGSPAAAVALGDLDHDGDLDAVVGNRDGYANALYINGGDRTFSLTTFGSGDTQGVALGDMDRDGDLDAVTANGAGPNLLYSNDGSGGLTGAAFGTSATSRAVALADIDGDGDLDAAFANAAGNTVYANDGSGGLGSSPAQSDLGSADSRGIALGDLDRDGDPDMIVANAGANRVYLNQGGEQGGTAGTFLDSGQALGDAVSAAVALRDLDGDGDLDAVFANDDADAVWVNDGTGVFDGAPVPIRGEAATTRALALGDLDGDGDLDAVAANEGANAVHINQPPVVEFARAAHQAAEEDGSVVLRLRRGTPVGTASVDYAPSGGSAEEGSDYSGASGTVSFSDGEVEKHLSISLATDDEVEGDETVSLTLSNPTGLPLGSQSTATLTITDSTPPVPEDEGGEGETGPVSQGGSGGGGGCTVGSGNGSPGLLSLLLLGALAGLMRRRLS